MSKESVELEDAVASAAQPEAPGAAPGDEASNPDTASPPPSVADLQQALNEAEASRDEHEAALLRAKAELDNLRKRTERDLQNAHKFALERFVQALLPVKDSMEMGLAAASDDSADVAKLREGTELTLRMLSAATEKFGVVEVDPLGQPFDPERHQAISTVASTQTPSGAVVTVVQKGYLLNERLVRPAMVIVAE